MTVPSDRKPVAADDFSQRHSRNLSKCLVWCRVGVKQPPIPSTSAPDDSSATRDTPERSKRLELNRPSLRS